MAPNELHDWWEEVSQDLDECRQHDKDNVWLEDIYAAIRMGQAQLFVGLLGERYAGMAVLTQHQDQWEPKRRFMHIWYMRNRFHEPSIVKQGVDQLDLIAKAWGCSMMTFRADRPAWERWGNRFGFKFGEIELRREVNA